MDPLHRSGGPPDSPYHTIRTAVLEHKYLFTSSSNLPSASLPYNSLPQIEPVLLVRGFLRNSLLSLVEDIFHSKEKLLDLWQ